MSFATDPYSFDELLTDEEIKVRDRVRSFCDDEVLPVAAEYWDRAEFPVDLFRRLADVGVAGAQIDGFGCPGLSAVGSGLVAAELARGDGSLSTAHGVHTGLAMNAIAICGSDEQRERWLPPMARMELLGAFALTEPEHGSDVVNLATRARRDGDDWVLDGSKRWIGLGEVADIVVVWARDEDGDVGGFVIDHSEGRVQGYDAQVIWGKSSKRAVNQTDITLSEVRVPGENRLEGAKTFEDTEKVLTVSRHTVAWEALGVAQAVYEQALDYVMEREQFGQPIASFQLIQDKLARMLADITTMRFLCLRLGRLLDEDRMNLPMASLAKMNNAAAARRICLDARDVMGGNGILLENHVARHLADVESVFTYEGADSVHSLVVGRAITGIPAFA